MNRRRFLNGCVLLPALLFLCGTSAIAKPRPPALKPGEMPVTITIDYGTPTSLPVQYKVVVQKDRSTIADALNLIQDETGKPLFRSVIDINPKWQGKVTGLQILQIGNWRNSDITAADYPTYPYLDSQVTEGKWWTILHGPSQEARGNRTRKLAPKKIKKRRYMLLGPRASATTYFLTGVPVKGSASKLCPEQVYLVYGYPIEP